MRHPQRAYRFAAVLASLVVVTLFPTPADAARAAAEPVPAPVFGATARCTQWSNQYRPPRTIRVLRTARTGASKEVAGTVQEVDFREYVAVVMAQEWPEHYPFETLKAGAIATKQFAWYYILFPRGGTKWIDGKKVCYDVIDTTVDQWYSPEQEEVIPNGKIERAIDATWHITLRKFRSNATGSRFFLTGYRAGSTTVCGADANGYKLYHHSTKACGNDGLKFREILRLYLSPNLEIVEPGRHDIISTQHGDASAMLKKSSVHVAHVWTPGRKPPEPGSHAGVRLSNDDLLGFKSADMDGDGKDDLVWLRRTGARSAVVRVALSDGVNYGDSEVWWQGDTIVATAGAKLLVGDFHADDRVDVAILGRGNSQTNSKLVVLKRAPYRKAENFLAPTVWWSGYLDIGRVSSAWAGDTTGDGRADLQVRIGFDGPGVRIKTARTQTRVADGGYAMTGWKVRFEDMAIKPARFKVTLADVNRDGRDDLWLLIGGRRARVERLQGKNNGSFKRVHVWTAPKGDPISVKTTKLGTADIDYDGMGDLVLFMKDGTGTRIRPLKAGYDRMIPRSPWRASFDWEDVRPY